MSLERALGLQRDHMLDRGGTLAGYMAHFKPATFTGYMGVKRTWQADYEFLNVLVRAALLKNSGHDPADVATILRNRKFFEQVRTKGVAK